MKAFIVTLYFPLFSLKQPLAFQVADTNLLPSPSSLRGALAKSLAYIHPNHFNGNDFQSLVESWLRKVEEIVPFVTAKPKSCVIKGTVILSRLRTLEQRERKEPRDAMRRGITFLYKLKACFIVNERRAIETLGSGALNKIWRALWIMDRIGDTESLIFVSDVSPPIDPKQKIGSEGEVNTITNIDFAGVLDNPIMDNMDLCFTYEATGKKIRRPRYSRTHFLPLSVKRVRKFIVYAPYTYKVKVRRGSIYQIRDLKVVAGESL